ncbi:MAG: hypothetical protein ABSA96_10815 [Candidatus Acidiferrales bacterium]|jgi:hypothetical protein
MDESALRTLLDSLEASRSALSGWLECWTFLVVAGVALEVVFVVWEYVEDLHDFGSGIVHPPERPSRLLFALGLLGAALVAIGVSGELYAESKIETVETRTRKANDELFLLLSKEAGEAAASAKTAHDEADAVGKKADALDVRLGSASRELGDIETDTFAISPRWRLLERGEDVFIKALKPFAGQRVTVVSCGREDTERSALENMLVSSSFPKAGWDKPGSTRWLNCPNILGGSEMYFVASTDDSAEWVGMPAQQWAKVQGGRFNISHDALNTLWEVLYKLRIRTTAWREKPLPQDEGIQKARMLFGDGIPDSPAELAYKDPGRIFLLITPNVPMFGNADLPPEN